MKEITLRVEDKQFDTFVNFLKHWITLKCLTPRLHLGILNEALPK